MILNKDIVESFEHLRKIFPEMVSFSPNTFYLYIKFEKKIDCILQMNNESDEFLDIYVHCYHENFLLLNYVKWFFWIFAISQ